MTHAGTPGYPAVGTDTRSPWSAGVSTRVTSTFRNAPVRSLARRRSPVRVLYSGQKPCDQPPALPLGMSARATDVSVDPLSLRGLVPEGGGGSSPPSDTQPLAHACGASTRASSSEQLERRSPRLGNALRAPVAEWRSAYCRFGRDDEPPPHIVVCVWHGGNDSNRRASLVRAAHFAAAS